MTGRAHGHRTRNGQGHTCGDERRVLLQLRAGQSLLVVQDAGVEDRAGAVAFFKRLSLW